MANGSSDAPQQALDASPRVVEVAWPDDLLRLHRLNPGRYPCLLESTAGGSALSRFDILFAFPGSVLSLGADGRLSGGQGETFLAAFDDAWRRAGPGGEVPGLPFCGGWFLLLGYELANQIEPGLRLPTEASQPIACAIRIPVAVIRDRQRRRAWIVAERQCETELGTVMHDLARPPGPSGAPPPVLADGLQEEPPGRFLESVAAARKLIAAGDIFQANLSRVWRGDLAAGVEPADVYARLRSANPSPFGGLAVLGDLAVVSSSPERLLRLRGGCAETRPIAGTRPRASTGRDDESLRRALLANPKERAEHVMVIDLERNDLGRVCRPGSVRVSEFMTLESYSHVHHIVSNVCGRLAADATPGRVLAALFPGGSITGCPKVRCMEIIQSLEQRARGFYTGSMGYINHDGSGDFNILIRTMVVQKRAVTFATGSGIVSDSVPADELAETRAKARGLIVALQPTG